MPKHYQCPQCGTEIVWDESAPFRPFCSQRCKMIDLGTWANEENKIPENLIENPEDFLELE